VTLSEQKAPLTAWETVPFYTIFRKKRHILVVGNKPKFFGKKIPTQRDQRQYRSLQKFKNPIQEARRYQQIYELPSIQTYAQVAQHFGVSRARVCQYLNLLKLPKEMVNHIESIDDPEESRYFTERRLRGILKSEESSGTFQALAE